MTEKENKLLLYKDEEGRVNVNVRFAYEDVWLTQAQLAEIYNTTQQNISLHQKAFMPMANWMMRQLTRNTC